MRIRFFLLVLLASLAAAPAHAWDQYGHAIVARIAWEHMTPAARARAVALLRSAPEAAGLRQMEALVSSRPDALRERDLFLLASTWADQMRDDRFPERRARYHHGNWHYTNWFWEQSIPGGSAKDRTDLKPDAQNVVERLSAVTQGLADASQPDSARAIWLAWTLHLAGDVHQPLHTSARVTATEPEGDEGGNLFPLDGKYNLHGYWDSIVRRAHPQREGESQQDYIERLAGSIMYRYPSVPADLKAGDFEAWSLESYRTAREKLYPATLVRGRRPLLSYKRMATETAEAALASAGYRLADLLNRTLG